jgi:hypothetical protein
VFTLEIAKILPEKLQTELKYFFTDINLWNSWAWQLARRALATPSHTACAFRLKMPFKIPSLRKAIWKRNVVQDLPSFD